MDFLKRKSIFDIIKEAEDEQDGGGSTSSSEEESGTSTTDSGEEGTDGAAETQEDNSSEENDYGEDEDFNIDTFAKLPINSSWAELCDKGEVAKISNDHLAPIIKKITKE